MCTTAARGFPAPCLMPCCAKYSRTSGSCAADREWHGTPAAPLATSLVSHGWRPPAWAGCRRAGKGDSVRQSGAAAVQLVGIWAYALGQQTPARRIDQAPSLSLPPVASLRDRQRHAHASHSGKRGCARLRPSSLTAQQGTAACTAIQDVRQCRTMPALVSLGQNYVSTSTAIGSSTVRRNCALSR